MSQVKPLSRNGTSLSLPARAQSAVLKGKKDLVETSLGIFHISNPVRVLALRIMGHRVFGMVVLALIVGNCFFLALTEPFPTCCTETQMGDDTWIKADVTNFSIRCDMDNVLVDVNEEQVAPHCCINKTTLEGDPWNKCASVNLKNAQESAEVFFNIMFTIEMTIKVVALGFISGKGTYLRDAWNILDFVVVAVGWLSYVPGIANFSALRTFRVLRPLRTLSSIPGMRPIVSAMLACVKSMIHVFLLCCFLFTVFGIVGLQLFSGTLKGRCHYVDPNGSFEHASLGNQPFDFSMMSLVESDEKPCPLPCNKVNADGSFSLNPWTRSVEDCLELSGPTCQERGKVVVYNPFFSEDGSSTGIVSLQVELPEQLLKDLPADADYATYGNGTFTQFYDVSLPTVEVTSFCLDTGVNQLGSSFANFDNIGYSWLTILTSITLEGWVDIMYGIQASFGHSFVVFLYFFIMVWLCSFFMLELTLAVINDAYDRAAEQEAERMKAALESALESEMQAHVAGSPESIEENAEALENYHEKKAHEEKYKLKPWGPKPVQTLFHLVQTTWFQSFVTLLIVLNTITLGMESHGMSQEKQDFLKATNLFFTVAFLIEMVLKVIGLGIRQYCWDSFNIFDAVIVTISLVELILDDGGSGLGALRTFRLMRVFKLARSWKNLRKLLTTILLSVMDVTNAAILLVIIMFIFTLLGMQLFGGKWTGSFFCDDPLNYEECAMETPRANFDSFWWGFVTVFQILTGENWNEVMYIGKTVNGEVSWMYFVSLNVVGNYMVLNLFLAILLARFENDEEDEENAEEDGEDPKRQVVVDQPRDGPTLIDSPNKTNKDGNQNKENSNKTGSAVVAPMPNHCEDDNIDSKISLDSAQQHVRDEVDPNKMIMNKEAYAFFVFAPDMPLRQQVFKFINSSPFDNFILLLIGISTVLLAVEEPYIEECKETTCKTLADFLYVADIVLNCFFFAEMALKMFALGVILHSNSYLRGGWNVLDFAIVLISVASLVLGGEGAIKALKSLRSLRALRPLRVISRSPGMRLVVNAIIAAIPAIANVTVVVILFMLIFAIIGVQQFAGGLNSCNDPEATTKYDCVGYNDTHPLVGPPPTFIPVNDSCYMLPTDELIDICIRNGTGGCQTCYFEDGTIGFPRVWGPNGGFVNSYNFDNVGNSLLVVFEVVSGEMWPDIMYSTMDIVGPDEPMLEWPHRQNRSVAWWYIMVTLVCAFLMINVFVGVIIDNFNQMKDAQNGSGLLTDEQKLWIETMKNTMGQKPIKRKTPPTDPLRLKAWKLIQSPKFEVFIMSVILLNTLMMMLQADGISNTMNMFTDLMNIIFLGLFTIEMGIKLFALRKEYFYSAWNCFDGSLVFFGYLGMMGGLGPLASLLRIFRVARIFRLVRTSPGLLTIFRTLVFSIPSMINVCGIFLLLMLIYAILGMNLFSKIKHGELLNEDANFSGFFISIATLFRITTGESFNGIMHDCMIQEPYCSEKVGNCGYPVFAPIYFCSYFLLSAYTLLSMITAIILDNFNDNTAMAQAAITQDHIEEFKEEWARLDPQGTMFIKEELLVKLVSNVRYPLGVKNTPEQVAKGKSRRKLANALIRRIDVPSLKGSVAFNDVLTELTSAAMPDVEIPHENEMLVKIKDKKNEQQTKLLEKLGTSKENVLYTAAQCNSIMLVQSAFRGFIQRKNIQLLLEKQNPDLPPPTHDENTTTCTDASETAPVPVEESKDESNLNALDNETQEQQQAEQPQETEQPKQEPTNQQLEQRHESQQQEQVIEEKVEPQEKEQEQLNVSEETPQVQPPAETQAHQETEETTTTTAPTGEEPATTSCSSVHNEN